MDFIEATRKHIKRLRKSLNLSGPEISRLSNKAMSHSALSRLEQGVMNWHLRHLDVLGKVFDCHPIFLISGVDELKKRIAQMNTALERIHLVMQGQGSMITPSHTAQLRCKPLFKRVPAHADDDDGVFKLVIDQSEGFATVNNEQGSPVIFGFAGTLEHLAQDIENAWHWTSNYDEQPDFSKLELQVLIANGLLNGLSPWCVQRSPNKQARVYEIVIAGATQPESLSDSQSEPVTGHESALLEAYRNRDSARLLKLASERLNS